MISKALARFIQRLPNPSLRRSASPGNHTLSVTPQTEIRMNVRLIRFLKR